MKKLIFTIVLFGALIAIPKQAEAQRNETLGNSSELLLRMYDNSMFIVILDRRIYDSPTSQFRLSNINPGSHRIVIKKKYGRYGSESIIYNGSINIPPRSVVNARINKYNRLEITRINDIVRHDEYRNYDNYYNDGYYNKPLLDLNRLQISMQHASFENDKLRIAEQAISSHTVRANQIYRILMMFNFESTKLKLAKFSYTYCQDKNNYYLVNDAFTFSSSIRELDNYIGHQRNDYNNNHDGYNNRW